MVTEIDEKKGLVKTYWNNIRTRVSKVAPEFAALIDELEPNKTFPVYLAYFPYGALKGDTISPFIPDIDGGFYRLSDLNAPKDVIQHLGYGKNSSPLGLLLDKKLEYFIDSKDLGITIPWVVASPGKFFPLARVLPNRSKRVYAPNGLLSVSSGVRSTFMLPNIGCQVNHSNLQCDFNIQLPPPKTLYDHWYVFKELINNPTINSDWRSCILYFSEKWLDKIQNDKQWLAVKTYLYEHAWDVFEFDTNRIYYDLAYSLIQNKRNLRPNPYLVDTARHLFTTALGAAPGYVPAIDSESMPVEILRDIFINSYGLKKYYPTIMQAAHFDYENDPNFIYYSLQNPSTYISSPKSRKASSTIVEMRELKHIMQIFIDELSQKGHPCSDTVIHDIACNIEFNYFHNKADRHKMITPSAEIAAMDPRINSMDEQYKLPASQFAADAPFVRGCISMRKKPQNK